MGDRTAVLASADGRASSARLQIGECIEAFKLGAEDTCNRAGSHTGGTEGGLGRTGGCLFLVLRDSTMMLGIVSGGAPAWLRARRSRRSRLAALSIRIPFPIRRAGWDWSWGRVLRHTAALLTMPIPAGRAVVSSWREWRRWVSVRKAARAVLPPPLARTTVIVGGWWSSRRAAGVSAGVPDPAVATRRLVERRDISRSTAVGVFVPEP